MKFGRKMLNMHYIMIRVEPDGYDPPRTTLRVLEEDPSKMAKSCQIIVATYETSRRAVDGLRRRCLIHFQKGVQNMVSDTNDDCTGWWVQGSSTNLQTVGQVC